MARTSVATVLVLAILCAAANAGAEQCARCGCKPLALVPPDPELKRGPSQAELEGLLAGGAAMAITSYLFGVLVSRTAPHSNLAVDGIPVVGSMIAAARAPDGRNASVLSFLGGAQAMGLLIIAAAATDLAERRRLLVDISAGPNGCSASLTVRLP